MIAAIRPLVATLAIVSAVSGGATAQQSPRPQGFSSADAAAAALTEAVRRGDGKALAAMLGGGWRDFMLTTDPDFERERAAYLKAWDESHKITIGGDKATVEVGKTGWTLPIVVAKDGAEWRFDIAAGLEELHERELGRNEMGAIQTLLAIGDAQREYAGLDPMRTGAPVYARRLLSTAGRKDGLYWPSMRGEPASPLGEQVARSQVDGARAGSHYGYNFRLLYGQGPAAPGGARSYVLNGRMIGGFGAIAWPSRYADTGIMTFITGYNGTVYQQDLGTDTPQRASAITVFDPDKGWAKADVTPP